jgi:hypothetical protein
MRTRLFAAVGLAAAILSLSGCASIVGPSPRPLGENHVARLLARPDFPAAKAAAPSLARDALETINELQLRQP